VSSYHASFINIMHSISYVKSLDAHVIPEIIY
jgi:hypothetical protein